MSDELSDIFGEDRELREELEEITRMLQAERPVPSPAFRAALLARVRRARVTPRPSHLRARALALAVAGGLFLAPVLLGLAGSGPLAPSRTAATPAARLSH